MFRGHSVHRSIVLVQFYKYKNRRAWKFRNREKMTLCIYIHYIWKWLVKGNVRNNSSPQLICFWICKYFAIKSLVQGRWRIGVDRAEENPARSHNSRSNFYYATEIELLFALQAVRLIRLAPATWHFLLSRLLFLPLFYPLVSRK